MHPTTDQVLRFLCRFDVPEKVVSVSLVVTFLAIAEGCDHKRTIEERTGIPMRQAARLAKQLAGRDRWGNGRWIVSPFALVDVRPHPHRLGMQYRLTEQGQEVYDLLRSPQPNGQGTPGKSV